MPLENITCYNCEINFSVDSTIVSKWRNEEYNFHCPNGHRLVFKKNKVEAEVSQLKEEVKVLNAEISILCNRLDEIDNDDEEPIIH